jgi:hypothetical protein
MNKLNNKYIKKQLQPLKVQDRQITYDKKIANCFNAHFTSAYKLANNLKKQEEYFKRHIKIPTNSHFNEISTQTFQKNN